MHNKKYFYLVNSNIYIQGVARQPARRPFRLSVTGRDEQFTKMNMYVYIYIKYYIYFAIYITPNIFCRLNGKSGEPELRICLLKNLLYILFCFIRG